MVAKKISSLKNSRGMAVIEMIPIIVIVVLLLNFSIGFFGAIHTGILHSISARNYAFETFRHQPNLYYLRQPSSNEKLVLEKFTAGGPGKVFVGERGSRVHSTTGKIETSGDPKWIATSRNITFFKDMTLLNQSLSPETEAAANGPTVHMQNGDKNVLSAKNEYGLQNETVQSLTSIWVRPQYGICFNSKCGGN